MATGRRGRAATTAGRVRIVHVADYRGPYTGSFVPMLRAAVDEIRRRSWTAELVFGEDARGRAWLSELRGDGVRVRFVSRDRRVAWRELAATLQGTTDEVLLHTHFSRFDVPAVAAAAGRPRTRVFWHAHTQLSERPVVRLRNIARCVGLGWRVEQFLCVAPHIVEQLARRGAPRSRLVLFPNAIDAGRFPLATAFERRTARSLLGLPGDAQVVLHFGRDWYGKGGDIFLAAARMLIDGGCDRLVPVTVGAPEEATARAARLGISNSLVAIDSTERVGDLYAAADVFVSPSRGEGMPFAVAEALSRGLGVVVSDLPGHRQIGAGLGAARVAANDPAAIAAAVRSLLARDAATVAADRRAAHEWTVANMDLARWAERLAALYERALTQQPRPR